MKYLAKVQSKHRVAGTILVATVEVEAPDEKVAVFKAKRDFATVFRVSPEVATVRKLEVIE